MLRAESVTLGFKVGSLIAAPFGAELLLVAGPDGSGLILGIWVLLSMLLHESVVFLKRFG